MNSARLVVSPHPHIHSGRTLPQMMQMVMLALIPAIIFSVYLFGFDALRVIIIAMGSAVGWEALIRKITNRPLQINDLTALSSGLILAMLLPPTIPWWMILIGTLVMILLGKEVFGCFGTNPFNGVLIAWVVLKMSYPDFMLDWLPVAMNPEITATPMEIFKNQGPSFTNQYFSLADLFFGTTTGPLGQGSAFCLLLGGGYLLYKKVINWRIPVSYLAAVFAFSGFFWALQIGSGNADPFFHVLAGGSMIAAFFLATDPPSSPTTPDGMILFGILAGILTVIIRMWGVWTFGAFYAVLITSMFTPFLDKIAPVVYGR
ncbi:MAG: RnfABCDGE type electron transport complex subunit D [Desulfohalobiaceae bacterium]|nr:RnfABCDGE type electron transport complex subunit D [Desulfohalobiaceae bacterium]